MLISSKKYQFDDLEFLIPDEFVVSPGTVTPFFLDDLCSNLNLISFKLKDTNNEEFIHISTREVADDSWEILNQEFDEFVKKLNLDIQNKNTVKIEDNDAIDVFIGHNDDNMPKMRLIVFRRNNKEYNFIYTVLKVFNSNDDDVSEFFDNLKFIK